MAKMRRGDMWPFKKEKPKIGIVGDCEVIDPFDAVDIYRIPPFEGKPEDCAFKRSTIDEAFAPKPDTIESLIYRLIELGEPKPEVVITGEKRADGSEEYRATIDGKLVEWTLPYSRITYTTECSHLRIEFNVINALKDRLSRVVTETTTITY